MNVDQVLLQKIIGDSGDCESVADLGCMFGDYLAGLSHIPRRTGIDIFISYFQDFQGGPETHCICADIRDWTPRQRDQAFDLVLLIDVIEHLPHEDGERLLPEILRIAAKRVILYTPEGMMDQTAEDAAQSIHEVHGVPAMLNRAQEHLSGWTRVELETFGFEVEVMPKPYRGHKILYAKWER